MFISHKSNVLQTVHETEWQCRRKAKGQTKAEYWTWLDSVTSGDPPVVDLSGETGYVIVECTDEGVRARLNQLGDYVSMDGVYNIKWSDSKVSAVTGQDMGGNDITIETHFTGDNTAKDARLLAEMWIWVRNKRTRLLVETDWWAMKDRSMTQSQKDYRKVLRDLPATANPTLDENGQLTNITWPTKPE